MQCQSFQAWTLYVRVVYCLIKDSKLYRRLVTRTPRDHFPDNWWQRWHVLRNGVFSWRNFDVYCDVRFASILRRGRRCGMANPLAESSFDAILYRRGQLQVWWRVTFVSRLTVPARGNDWTWRFLTRALPGVAKTTWALLLLVHRYEWHQVVKHAEVGVVSVFI